MFPWSLRKSFSKTLALCTRKRLRQNINAVSDNKALKSIVRRVRRTVCPQVTQMGEVTHELTPGNLHVQLQNEFLNEELSPLCPLKMELI